MIIKNLTKIYNIKNDIKVNAINNISLELPDKGIVFIVGKSGSGKSTLLNLIGGLDKPTSGNIIIDESSIFDLNDNELSKFRRQKIGFIFQDFNLIETLNIKENIALSLDLNGIKYTDKDIESSLESVELNGYSNRIPNTLSGGQRQRVAIARAIIKKPKVILADEPTGALDNETSKQVFNLLKNLSKDNLIVVVSHDLEFAKEYGDRLIEIKDGVVINDQIISKKFNNDTLINDIKVPNYKATLNTKSKFPINKSLKLGMHYLFIKKLRVTVTLFMLLLTLLLFGFFSTLLSFNVPTNGLKSIYETNEDKIILEKFIDLPNSIEMFSGLQTSQSDIDYFSKKYKDISFIPIMEDYSFSISSRINIKDVMAKDLYASECNGAISITNEFLLETGYQIIAGTLPTNENQIVITKYIYESFKFFGFKKDNDETIDINNPQEMIGLNIEMNGVNYEISGVLDTKLDLNKYNPLFEEKKLEYLKRSTLKAEFSTINYGSQHTLIYMHENIINKYENDYDKTRSSYKALEIKSNFISNYKSYKYSKYSNTKPTHIIWVNKELDSLKNNQVILPLYSLYRYTNDNTTRIDVIASELIEQFVLERFSEIKTEFEQNETIDYKEYISYRKENLYHPGFTSEYFMHEAFKSWISQQDISDFLATLKVSSNITESLNIEIVGFYNDHYYNDNTNDESIFLSDEFFDSISIKHHFNPYKGIFVILSKEEKQDYAFIKEITENKKEIYYDYNNMILAVADRYQEAISVMSQILLYTSIVLIIISMFQIYTLISQSIENKKKDIGILRSLGAQIKDISKIFVGESLILASISAFLAILINLIFILVANHILKTHYSLPLTLLIFSYKQILIIILIAFVSAFLSSIIPVYFYSKKNPIDTIRLT